jgi:NADH:ubiquinone oxidoreductase subunit 3 (subunit A)
VSAILLSPPAVIALALVLVSAIYWIGGRISAKSPDSPGKHLPYASGEDLAPPKSQLAYHSFFRIALLFGILHLATLVISTVPLGSGAKNSAALYLVAIAISVYALTKGEQ